jgi:hypothetical protein
VDVDTADEMTVHTITAAVRVLPPPRLRSFLFSRQHEEFVGGEMNGEFRGGHGRLQGASPGCRDTLQHEAQSLCCEPCAHSGPKSQIKCGGKSQIKCGGKIPNQVQGEGGREIPNQVQGKMPMYAARIVLTLEEPLPKGAASQHPREYQGISPPSLCCGKN